MNYLKIKIEPIGCKHIHQQLEKAFISYMLGRGWVLRINKETGLMAFYSIDPRGKQRTFKIVKGAEMRQSAQIEYHAFLKMYLIKGPEFLQKLENSLSNVRKVG